MVESQAELEAFFNPTEFGDTAVFRWAEEEREVAGLFDDPAVTLSPGGLPTSRTSPVMTQVADFTSLQPRFICPSHLATGIPRRADVTIAGRDFSIADRRSEGGLQHFFLHEL